MFTTPDCTFIAKESLLLNTTLALRKDSLVVKKHNYLINIRFISNCNNGIIYSELIVHRNYLLNVSDFILGISILLFLLYFILVNYYF